MRKIVSNVFGLAVLSSSWATSVCGQQHVQPMATPGFYNGLTPNSTPEGDAARLGAYGALMTAQGNGFASVFNAIGLYNLNSAQADAIDARTMITWNEYIYSCLEAENQLNQGSRTARRDRLRRQYRERKERIAYNPSELDLFNGDALNALLEQLSNPKIHPYVLKKSGESIPGETLQRCAFRYPSQNLTVSLGRLTVRDGWPLSLRGVTFKEEREAYRDAVEKALEQNLSDKLTPEAFRALKRAVEALKDELKKTIPADERESFVQAKVFLEDLEDAVAPLHDPNCEKVLAGVDRYAGTTVGEAVAFMQRFNVRFAPALTQYERESYHLLYAAMDRLKNEIGAGGPAGLPLNGRKPAIVIPPVAKAAPLAGGDRPANDQDPALALPADKKDARPVDLPFLKAEKKRLGGPQN